MRTGEGVVEICGDLGGSVRFREGEKTYVNEVKRVQKAGPATMTSRAYR